LEHKADPLQTKMRQLTGGQALKILPSHPNLTAVCAIKSADDVQQAGFART